MFRKVDDKEVTNRWIREFPLILEGYERLSQLTEGERGAFPYEMIYVLLLFAAGCYERGEEGDPEHQLDSLEWVYENLGPIQAGCLRRHHHLTRRARPTGMNCFPSAQSSGSGRERC